MLKYSVHENHRATRGCCNEGENNLKLKMQINAPWNCLSIGTSGVIEDCQSKDMKKIE